MNQRIKISLYSVLVTLVSLSCEDHTSQEKLSLSKADLEEIVLKQATFNTYVSTTAMNFITISNLDASSVSILEQLELRVRENNSYELSMQLLSAYQDVGYDINFHQHYATLLSALNSKYIYAKEDLASILTVAIQEHMMNRDRFARIKTPIGYGCVEPCQSNASAAYDNLIASASGIEKAILTAEKNAYFRGCYDYCIDYPQTPN